MGLCRPVCLLLSPAPGGLVALVPRGRLAVRLVLVRANLGSKCECGFSLGLLAQAAFAIGFLDTSWEFNLLRGAKPKLTSGSVDQTAQLRPTIKLVGVVAERPVRAAPRIE